MCVLIIFFFQAEDGIRDGRVTGVQTCALPIWHFPVHESDAGSRMDIYRGLLQRGAHCVSICWLHRRPHIQASPSAGPRSEERRVGKECRSRCAREPFKIKEWESSTYGKQSDDN